MSDEYLVRSPAITGNRRVLTFSVWVKLNNPSGTNQYTFGVFPNGANAGNQQTMNVSQSLDNADFFLYDAAVTRANYSNTNIKYRDSGNWMHYICAVNTTEISQEDRVKIYINGVRISGTVQTAAAQNLESWYNTATYPHWFGNWPGLSTDALSQYFDAFLVDGISLTPDVFGYYKKGAGYISGGSGTSGRTTNIKNGQWLPKSPKVIKSVINARGGFGVNGFYMPLNDSSNFGADFHTTPNSIIKLKDEDAPQPRNGAPTTTDSYVSQLRTDPFKDYLVLAVAGAPLSTGNNLLSNSEYFDSNLTGWTGDGFTVTTVSNGTVHVEQNSGTTAGISQTITTVVGQRYTISGYIKTKTGTVYGGGFYASSVDRKLLDLGYIRGFVSQSEFEPASISFTATATTTYITLVSWGAIGDWVEFKNVVVKAENVPKDYSANIKGNGTNKILTPNNVIGVTYNYPSHYGSAIYCQGSTSSLITGSNNYLSIPDSSDFDIGLRGEPFTWETWFNITSTTTEASLGVARGGGASGWNSSNGHQYTAFYYSNNNTVNQLYFQYWTGSTLASLTSPSNIVTAKQWHHVAVTYDSSRTLRMFLDGVMVAQQTSVTFGKPSLSNITRIGMSAAADAVGNSHQTDIRLYKGVVKYSGSFDVPKPYTPVGFEPWRAVPDTTANNFASWNPLFNGIGNLSITNGNLSLTESTTSTSQMSGTVEVSSGKWYYETHIGANPFNGSVMCGIAPATRPSSNVQNRTSYRSNGDVYTDTGTTAQSGTTYTTGDIIGVAFDVDAKKLWFSKNGSWVYSGQPSTGGNAAVTLTLDAYSPFTAFDGGVGTAIVNSNFGQNPTFSGNTTAGIFTDSNGKGLFKYQPPTGFLALCEDNVPTPAISDPGKYFKTVLWNGDGNSGRNITGVGFQPDLVWIKDRTSSTYNLLLHDSVRGVTNTLRSSSNSAESVQSPPFLYSFNSDGFSISSQDGVNRSGNNHVAWCWKAGNSTSTNTSGSITSQVSANPDAGFSIVSYTGNGLTSATIGHGLGKVPSFMMIKSRGPTDRSWGVYHKSIGNTGLVYLDLTNGTSTASFHWNNTSPTSSVFTVGNGSVVNTTTENYIAYCWAEIEEFSKFGSYVGNLNINGPFVYCGFKPAWVLIKGLSSSRYWYIFDSSRGPTNPNPYFSYANDTTGEGVGTVGTDYLDFLSNGFKLRSNNVAFNGSGETYIFAAFAESPFQTANAK